MLYRIAADGVVLLHLCFILLVVLGGLAALRWRWFAWVHLPAALWGVMVELQGRVCPLTPLEVHLRRQAGQAGYPGGFIEHYLIPLIYPGALTRSVQIGLGLAVLLLNLVLYARYWRGARRHEG